MRHIKVDIAYSPVLGTTFQPAGDIRVVMYYCQNAGIGAGLTVADLLDIQPTIAPFQDSIMFANQRKDFNSKFITILADKKIWASSHGAAVTNTTSTSGSFTRYPTKIVSIRKAVRIPVQWLDADTSVAAFKGFVGYFFYHNWGQQNANGLSVPVISFAPTAKYVYSDF